MLGGLGDIAGMMGKVKDMQKKLKDANDEIENMITRISSEDGRVSVTMRGRYEITSLEIDNTLMSPEGTAPIEFEVKNTINKALAEAQAIAKQRIAEAMEGMPIPDDMKNLIS